MNVASSGACRRLAEDRNAPLVKEPQVADTKSKIKDTIDDAAAKTKNAASKAVDKTKEVTKAAGEKIKDIGKEVKKQGS